jgi:hypothetical protein
MLRCNEGDTVQGNAAEVTSASKMMCIVVKKMGIGANWGGTCELRYQNGAHEVKFVTSNPPDVVAPADALPLSRRQAREP